MSPVLAQSIDPEAAWEEDFPPTFRKRRLAARVSTVCAKWLLPGRDIPDDRGSGLPATCHRDCCRSNWNQGPSPPVNRPSGARASCPVALRLRPRPLADGNRAHSRSCHFQGAIARPCCSHPKLEELRFQSTSLVPAFEW